MLDMILVFIVAFGAIVGMTYLHYALYYRRISALLGLNPWKMAWRSLQFKSPIDWDKDGVTVSNAKGNG